jgi:hypothetical protein
MWVNLKEDGEEAGRESVRRQEVDKTNTKDNRVVKATKEDNLKIINFENKNIFLYSFFG